MWTSSYVRSSNGAPFLGGSAWQVWHLAVRTVATSAGKLPVAGLVAQVEAKAAAIDPVLPSPGSETSGAAPASAASATVLGSATLVGMNVGDAGEPPPQAVTPAAKSKSQGEPRTGGVRSRLAPVPRGPETTRCPHGNSSPSKRILDGVPDRLEHANAPPLLVVRLDEVPRRDVGAGAVDHIANCALVSGPLLPVAPVVRGDLETFERSFLPRTEPRELF